jgi:YVTN family beta-propeller protein
MRLKRISLSIAALSLALVAAHLAAALPSSLLLVVNKDESSLSIIDPATGSVLGRVPTGDGPHEVTVSTDGTLAFVGNNGVQGPGAAPGRTISVIDLAQLKEVRRVDLGVLRRPHGLAFANGKLYFTAEVNKVIARYDPASNQVDMVLGSGQNNTHVIRVNGNATRIATSNIGSNSITIFEQGNSADAWNATAVPVGQGPEGIDVSPDGEEIWTAHSRDGGVSIINVATKKVVQTLTPGTKRSNHVKFTPDGRQVLLSDAEGDEILVYEAATRKEITRVKLAGPDGFVIVPDGSRAYISMSRDNAVAVMDLKTFEILRRIPTGKAPHGVAWVERR